MLKHSSFLVKSELQNIQKHSVMHQNTENISKLCFICFKCKICKNRWKTYKVCIIGSFSPSSFIKLSKLVPGYSKNLKKSPKVLLNQKVTQLVLWWKISQNVKFSPWTLKIVKNGPWDIKTLRKQILSLYFSYMAGLVLDCKFGEITQMVPEDWKFGSFSPWCI